MAWEGTLHAKRSSAEGTTGALAPWAQQLHCEIMESSVMPGECAATVKWPLAPERRARLAPCALCEAVCDGAEAPQSLYDRTADCVCVRWGLKRWGSRCCTSSGLHMTVEVL